MRVGLWRKLSAKELMLLTVVLEKTLESPLGCKEIQLVHSKGDQSWVFSEALMVKLKLQYIAAKSWLIRRLWCWEGLEAGGEGDDRGWDGWMASPTWWTWVWVNSGSWWCTGRPGVLQFMGSQRVAHKWVTELSKCQVIYHFWEKKISFLEISFSGQWCYQ